MGKNIDDKKIETKWKKMKKKRNKKAKNWTIQKIGKKFRNKIHWKKWEDEKIGKT